MLCDLLQIQRFDDLGGYGQICRVIELKIRAVLQTEITMANQLCIGCDAAAVLLTEDLIQSDDRDSVACADHVVVP